MKTCSRCSTEKADTEFNKNKLRADGLGVWCRSCNREYAREHKLKPEVKSRLRESDRRRATGWTGIEFLTAFALQGGKCAICSVHLTQGKTAADVACADHDHDTDEKRGILCRECNSGIGKLKDNPDLCEKACQYLRKHLFKFEEVVDGQN